MIDIHCHIEDDEIKNIENIINKCKENNVNNIILSGYDLESSEKAIELAKNHNEIYCTIGFLPNVIYENGYDLKKLEQLLINKKVIGIGEIGLDYYWYKDKKDKQKELFIKQINLANKYDLPVIIHCRDAINDCYEILKENKPKRAVMHCYSGSLEMAKKFIDLDIYISIGGISTFKNAKNIVKVIENIPLSYIVLETDSPYLTPEPHRGKKNYPYYISYIASRIAQIKGISIEEVENITTKNTHHLFDF